MNKGKNKLKFTCTANQNNIQNIELISDLFIKLTVLYITVIYKHLKRN